MSTVFTCLCGAAVGLLLGPLPLWRVVLVLLVTVVWGAHIYACGMKKGRVV